MARTLYIHVGPMKTGTSAIQYILSKHDNSVILYPKVGLEAPGSHTGLVYDFVGKSKSRRAPEESANESFSRIAQCARDSNLNLLISTEILLPSITRPRTPTDLRRFVRSLLNCMGTKDWEVEILFACREHFERAASAYSQFVRGRAREVRDPDEFLLGNVYGLRYAPIVRRLRNTGFKITALSYHPSESWTERFLVRVGFPKDQVPHSLPKNVSLTPQALIARLAANRTVRSNAKRTEFASSLSSLRKRQPVEGSIFGPEAMDKVRRQFAADRQFIQKEFGIRLPELQTFRNNTFFLDKAELADVETAARGLGSKGEAIVTIARQYLR